MESEEAARAEPRAASAATFELERGGGCGTGKRDLGSIPGVPPCLKGRPSKWF